MTKETNKKNVMQDVVPGKRSIRDIEMPSRAKTSSTIKLNRVKTAETRADDMPDPEPTPSYEYTEPEKPSRNSRKWPYVLAVVVVIATAFGISALFKSATITITPKQDTKTISDTFTAVKDSKTGLGFQVVTVTKSLEKTVSANGQKQVDTKAVGTIIIYNKYSATPQKLIATTRFQTPEGLIFRLVSPVTIPGKQTKAGATVAGSVEAKVEADKAGSNYNIGLKDFNLPSFKGSAQYSQIYARSKTEMTGGFSGLQKVVSKDVMDATDVAMEASLRTSLVGDITAQLPANFILYDNTISYSFSPTTQANSTETSAILSKKATVTAIIFDKTALTSAILSKNWPQVTADMAQIDNLNTLVLAFQTTSTTTTSANTVSFTLKGDAHLVWLFDQNKLKTDLLGLSKINANAIIATYPAIHESWIITKPFWSQTIPNDPKKVTLINTLAK